MAGTDTGERQEVPVRHRRFSGMRERLSLYFLLAVLLPLGFGTVVSERLIEHHIAGLGRNIAEERLDAVAGRLAERARMRQVATVQLGASPALVAAVAARQPEAVETVLASDRLGRELDVLELVGADGHPIARAPGRRKVNVAAPAGAAMAASAPFVRARSGETGISYEDWGERLVETIVAPVRVGERVVGVLLAGTVLTGNNEFCAGLVDRGPGEAAVSHSGRWIASGGAGGGPPGSLAGTPLDATQIATLQHHQRWVGQADARGTFVAIAPLVNAAGQVTGGIAARVGTAGLSDLKADARRSFVAAMGVGALASFLLALLVARRVTTPLRRLAHAATVMQRGRLDVAIPVEGEGEVAQLATAFKSMAEALSESIATLESRVSERVRELQAGRDREATLNRDLTAHNERLRAQGEQLRAQGDELERQRRELVEETRRSEEADRLKSAFIANMSHEIRTPLNSVLALSQLLRDGMAGSLSVDQRKYLEVIERNGQNLLRLINDILDLSRIEAGHLEMDLQCLDVEGQIRAAAGALIPLAETKGLDLQVRLPDELPPVRADADRVQQVLTNLIGNAIKFTEVGHIQVAAEAREDMVAIHVTDTGVGIPEAMKEKVFEEFFQVDQSMARRQRGTGLGLAIASRLAHLMGGDITVESVVGSGSRFTLTLPRRQLGAAGEADEAAVADAQANLPLDGRKVLLLEQDEGERLTLTRVLMATGIEVTATESAVEGARQLGSGGPRFDAIVVGRVSPGPLRDAWQASHLARIPVIVLLGGEGEANDEAAIDEEAEAIDEITAPVFGYIRRGAGGETGPALVAMLRKALRAPARTAGAPPPRDASILMVEDNEDNLFTMRQILGGLLVELVTAGTGREAIEFCKRRLPNLIVMDMQMPGMSGLQATGAIRALPGGTTIPIVALTAQAMKGDRERILAAGCDEYLSKPIQPKALLAVVKRLLRRPVDPADPVRPGPAGPRETQDEHGTHTAGR
jgi:signal transduction histidine kinase/CheY-like chemotaxis protein